MKGDVCGTIGRGLASVSNGSSDVLIAITVYAVYLEGSGIGR